MALGAVALGAVDRPAAAAVDRCGAAAVGPTLHRPAPPRPATSAGPYPIVVAPGQTRAVGLGVLRRARRPAPVAGTIDACTGDDALVRRPRHVRRPGVEADAGDDDHGHRAATPPARPAPGPPAFVLALASAPTGVGSGGADPPTSTAEAPPPTSPLRPGLTISAVDMRATGRPVERGPPPPQQLLITHSRPRR
ncbi:hypothetical protein [Micromonospora sp. NPDC005171]|uniref:hypothetical protein n=1 Tax=Micromonospora sp. NPDC005171 TaxID=3156866 RepID=UPI0033AC10D3